MRVLLAGLCMVLAGCAGMSGYQEPPQLNVMSFSLDDSRSGTPVIRVGLRVLNPNRTALTLVGMSYSVEVEGTRVLTGVASDLPEVPAYGTADFVVEASPDLLGSARVLATLLSRDRDRIAYAVSLRVDIGRFMRDLRVTHRGAIEL